MGVFQVFKALGPVDFKSVQRDALLRWMVFLPLVMGLGLRYAIPFLAEQLLAAFHFDISVYYVLGMAFILQTMPLLYGSVVGFLLLDERDDRTLQALQVTPLGGAGYLVYRTTLPVLLSLVGALVIVPLAGLTPMSLAALFPAAVAVAPMAPLFALFLAAFAQNKVQGFALMKTMGVVFLPAAAAYFVPMPLQLAFGVVLTYWPAKVFWLAQAGDPLSWIYLGLGTVYQCLVIAVLLRRFVRMVS
jgi:fluoroquinolone transport system permease protein